MVYLLDGLPFRPVATPVAQGPVVPGTWKGLAREAGDLIPMGLATERANLMARGLPPNVIATIQSMRVSGKRLSTGAKKGL